MLISTSLATTHAFVALHGRSLARYVSSETNVLVLVVLADITFFLLMSCPLNLYVHISP